MARENQGLQIALVIFVMLAALLGAFTWVFYQKSTENENKYKTELADKEKANQDVGRLTEESAKLREFISGSTNPPKFDDISKAFDKDKTDFGAGYPAESQAYAPLLKKLWEELTEKKAELKKKNEEIADWTAKYKVREASKDAEIKQLRKAADDARQELAAAKENFDTRRKKIEEQDAETQSKLLAERKTSEATIEKNDADIKKLQGDLGTTKKSLEGKTRVIDTLKRTIVDEPDGEIRWVDQAGGIVWINVGRADGLQPLMTFSVYPHDVSDLSKGAVKGSIEVTKILGEHIAEARITDDTVADPFLPGDKIDTSLWSPGEQLHFALAGLMDVDGNGRGNFELVKNLIEMNGGVLDCYEDEEGRVHDLDNMTINTRFLVKGGGGKRDENIAMISKGMLTMEEKAKTLGVQEISLKELLVRMGYKQAVRTGATGETDSDEYHPKPPTKEPRTKSSEIFKPREPGIPRSAN
jgi:hypothetical protein